MSFSSSKSHTSMKTDPQADRVEVFAVDGSEGMEQLTGHKQELRVSMGLGALIALSVANVAPTVAINGSLATSLSSGGPVAVLWGWVAVVAICLCIAASLAEMCSAWPHAAGQAFWAFMLAPPRYAPFLSYFTGFMNIAGGWALIAAGAWIFADGILGLAVAYNPDYVIQPWQMVVLYEVLLFLFFAVNLYIVRVLDACTKAFAVINLSSVLATIIALAACAPVKQKPSFVFGGWINETGWSNRGLVWLLGLLQSAFTMVGFEASAHLCEEAHDAARLAPIAIFGGTAVIGLVGFVWIITILFCMGDVMGAIGSPTGIPVLQVFWDAFGLKGAAAAFMINLILLGFAIIGIIAASSRAVWSMSRDGGFPGSTLFGKVNHKLQVPVYACLLQVTVPALLGLIQFGSSSIFAAFFQMTTVGYMLSYAVPIALILVRGRHHLPQAHWRMPDTVAKACNVVSLAYIPFICVLFCIPNFYPVTGENANYTSAIWAGATLICVIGWYAEVRRKFKGPASVAHAIEAEAGSASV
ncbi:hypothetical protein JCM10207_000417 [Rhodosporidiobolus poonsookiae]